MRNSHLTRSAIVLATLLVAPIARADDAHHPEQQSAPPSAAQRMPSAMQGAQGMPDMMQHMMQMMGQSGGMGMMGQSGTAGMGMQMQMMTEHVEGRIAFLRTELKIISAQSAAWDKFADALRENAKGMSTMGGMSRGMSGQNAASEALPQRAAREEKMLEARLEGVKKMRAALDDLYGVLTDEQKKMAETLMPPHMGMMPMGRM
jgi:hypothetical protein